MTMDNSNIKANGRDHEEASQNQQVMTCEEFIVKQLKQYRMLTSGHFGSGPWRRFEEGFLCMLADICYWLNISESQTVEVLGSKGQQIIEEEKQRLKEERDIVEQLCPELF